MSFSIRPFQKTDFEVLWRIDQACFDPQLAYSRVELAVYMRRPGSFTLVADTAAAHTKSEEKSEEKSGVREKSETRILGFVVAESRRRIGHIITIDVIAEARREGIGSALLDAAEDRLRGAGATVVALETPVDNLTAIRFYKQKRYFVEKTVPGYYSNHLDALLMKKELAPAPG